MDGAGKTFFWFSEEDLIIEVPFFQRSYVTSLKIKKKSMSMKLMLSRYLNNNALKKS